MEASTLRLRPTRPEDLAALVDFENLVFAHEPNRIAPRQWRYLLSRDPRLLVVVESHGLLVGVLVLACRRGGRSLRIYSLGVHPAARRQGVARRLLEHTAATARELGLSRLVLEVRDDNASAVDLYRAEGFVVAGHLHSYYGLGEHGLRMERALAPADGLPQV